MHSDLHQTRMLHSTAFTSDWLRELATLPTSLQELGTASLHLRSSLVAVDEHLLARSAILQVARANGTPFTFRQENADVVQEVTSTNTSALSSAGVQALGFHTDFGAPLETPWSHWGFRPDVIVLLCLAAPVTAHVATMVIAAEEIFDRLPAAARLPLFEAEYRFPVSYSMEPMPLDERTWSEPGPILRVTDDGIEVAVDLPTLRRHADAPDILGRVAATAAALAALQRLLVVLEENCLGTTVTLTPGSFLVFSNVRAVHARSEHPMASLEPRCLLRVYTTREEELLRAASRAVNREAQA